MRTTTERPRVTGEAPPAWWRRKAVRRTVRWTAIGITVVLVAVTLGGSLVRLSPTVRYAGPGGDADRYRDRFFDLT